MKKITLLLLSVLICAAVISCSMFTPEEETGTGIIVNLPSGNDRAAVPSDLSYYNVQAVCTLISYDSTLSTKGQTSSSVEFSELREGTYTVYVTAYNTSNTLIAEGKTTVAVTAGQKAEAVITLQNAFGITLQAYYSTNPGTIYQQQEIPYNLANYSDGETTKPGLIFKAVTTKDADSYEWILTVKIERGDDGAVTFENNTLDEKSQTLTITAESLLTYNAGGCAFTITCNAKKGSTVKSASLSVAKPE